MNTVQEAMNKTIPKKKKCNKAKWLSKGFPGGSDGKESTCNTGDPGLIPGSGRAPGGVNDNPLQYSCLENPMNRGGWGHKESDMTERLTL